MAVASDDWPRFSLLTGGGGAYVHAETPEIEHELLQHLVDECSVECWLQIRTRKGATPTQESGKTHACWLLHTPALACGLTATGCCVVCCDGTWLSTGREAPQRLHARRWHHLAVTGSKHAGDISVLLDGERLELHAGLEGLHGLELPISPTSGFRIGWAPVADSPCQLVLHEFRLWSARLSGDVVQRWKTTSISNEHPFNDELLAHWTCSSGSVLPREFDLSGRDLHLTVEKASWLRITPLHFHPVTTSDPARLVTYQDAETDVRSGRRRCNFVVEIQVKPPPDRSSPEKSSLVGLGSSTLVVLVLNFQCFRSPSLTVQGKGAGIIVSLQEFVRRLPDDCKLAIYDATKGEAILTAVAMSEDAKSRAVKILERAVIKTLIPMEKLAEITAVCIADIFQHPCSERCVVSAIIINEDTRGSTAKAAQVMEAAVETMQTSLRTVEAHTVHVNPTSSSSDRDPSPCPMLQTSCLSTTSVSCERDFEWTLAFLLHREQTLALVMGELSIQSVGGATFRLNNESQPQFRRHVDSSNTSLLVIPIGACAYDTNLVLSGVAEHPHTEHFVPGEALVTLTLSYCCGDGRRWVARATVRFADDLTNHVHIERAERNRRLRITDDDAMLLEQRRQLMKKKSDFVASLVAQEVAEAENMFKKINIMKEKLWAKRKWIVERALRIFEEDELQCLCNEAENARAQFAERIDRLQAGFVAHSRDLGSRGASRGGNRQEATAFRVRLDPDRRHSSSVPGADEEDGDTETQQLHKVSVKLSVQTKALNEHMAKMEDLFTSVRLAEAKGPVIMNDTRRSWLVRYQDMMNVKRDVTNLTLTKERIEQRMEFLAERVAPRQEVDAEVQSTNAAIARFDKELVKRRKRAALCMKEIVGSVVDEFEASQQVEAAQRDLAKCRLLTTLALREDMYQSCVYVCFPVELSTREVVMETPTQAFTNLVHGICCGLRRFCDTTTESPICRRLSFGESFLWWGVEQIPAPSDDTSLSVSLDSRRGILVSSWAVIVFSYNSMFSSTIAMADVKEALAVAIDQKKPVLHIELEQPFQGLEEFKRHWKSRSAESNAKIVPVEREFMMWRQNLASFQAALVSVEHCELIRLSGIPFGGCEHSSTSDPVQRTSFFPCLTCLWPRLSSSRILRERKPEQNPPEIASDGESTSWFIDLTCHVGLWLDEAQSASLQTAPRSYHIDPTAISLLSRAWVEVQQRRVLSARSKWDEARVRRTKEIQRQLGKLFKVYEEETVEVSALKFKFYKRRAEVITRMQEQLRVLKDQRNLLETRLNKLTQEDEYTEHGRTCKELESMASEELSQHIGHAETATLYLEELDERSETPPEHEMAAAKRRLEAALRQSSRGILDIGRTHIEDRFRNMMRGFKKHEYIDQIGLAEEKCEEYQAQVVRMTKVFEEAERIVAEMSHVREAFLNDDANAFFSSSCIEIRSTSSETTQETDLEQLRTLASDMDFHTSLCASVMSQALEAQLASSTALTYRARVQAASASFLSAYTPLVGATSDLTGSVGSLKDFCHFVADDPVKSWSSLSTMNEYVDQEALNDRERQRLVSQWKLRFMDTLVSLHFNRWWTTCQTQLRHTRGKLRVVKSAKEEAFDKRSESERAFRMAVTDRESCNHQLALLQRRLLETRQRQQFLLKILNVARHCYEGATAVMNEKLQNVKTDVIYKSWSSVSDYHVGLVGELFDWRSQCAQDLDALAEQVKECQQNLAASDGTVQAKRLEWLKQSIADHFICAQAERHEELAHRRLELILSLEKQRVFQQFRVLDPRGVWLTTPTLTAWYEQHTEEQRKAVAAGNGGAPPTRSGVDDALVQLTIARLDVIKQAKWRDALHRKLAVFERILHQQVEMRQIIDREVSTYRSLGDRLTRRVFFLRDKLEISGHSEFMNGEAIDVSCQASSFDRAAAVQATRASREQLQDFVSSAQQDFLAAEATTCQFSWRMQQHIASEYRAQHVIDQTNGQLRSVETYLEVLQKKDQELYEKGLRTEVISADQEEDRDTARETADMGMGITAGLSVFEFYARDQWFRTCLSQTTVLGERIKSLREVLSSLLAIKNRSSMPKDSENPEMELESKKPTQNAEDDDGGEEQLTLLERELQMVELALLLNRFESRTAEKTSEAVREKLMNGLMDRSTWNQDHLNDNDADVESVLPSRVFKARLFSVDVCVSERGFLLAQLRDFATSFDPRDVAGNLSEVIYGASLDVNDLKRIFLLQSKAHVEEQWSIVLIALFFARLFRRASLRKVATQRRAEASLWTKMEVRSIQARQNVATNILRLDVIEQDSIFTKKPSNDPATWIQLLMETVRIELEESRDREKLSRIALGVLVNRPLHRALVPMAPEAAGIISRVADEFEESRAIAERRPPKPTMLEVFLADRYTIKIQWKPIAMDHDLVYVAEISDHQPSQHQHSIAGQPPARRYWHQSLTVEKTNHTFYNLHPGHSYWIRVRSGFSKTKLGDACPPLLATTIT